MFNFLIIFLQHFFVLAEMRVVTGKTLAWFFVGRQLHNFWIFMTRDTYLLGCFKQQIPVVTLVRVVAFMAFALCRRIMQPEPFSLRFCG